jgi:RimJ/RimL family protein N-acetyltransferase
MAYDPVDIFSQKYWLFKKFPSHGFAFEAVGLGFTHLFAA